MTEGKLKPTKENLSQAKDRTSLFYDFIVNYIIHQPVYKLNKDYAKHIDLALESLAKAQEEI